jgi:pilus assembly protein CpaF
MALIDRLKRAEEKPVFATKSPATTQPGATPAKPKVQAHEPADPGPEAAYQDLKSQVHNRLFELLDLSRLGKVSEERVREDVAVATKRVLDDQRVLLSLEERERLVREIQDEVFGLGPLEPLLGDPTVSDVLVNGFDKIYVEHGKLEHTVARFKDDTHLMRIIEKIVSGVGRRVDEMNPMVDARLMDGSRVNAVIPPLALDGPMLSIRRFPSDPLLADDLVEKGTLTSEIVELMQGVVKCRLNVLLSGGTGSGKTTLLNVLSGFIPGDERIVTIEDSAELQLKQDHVVRLETRPSNIEGKGQVGQRQLVINSLRMRPDRIIVGEVRGSEAFDMLQAMNTGHDGSLTTVHANTPRDAVARVENMVSMAGLDIPQRAVRQQISSMEGDVVTMQEIFTLERHGIDEDGNVLADVVPTGIRPRFAEKLKLGGVNLPAELFERRQRQ